MHRGFLFQIDIRDLPFRFTHCVPDGKKVEAGGGGELSKRGLATVL